MPPKTQSTGNGKDAKVKEEPIQDQLESAKQARAASSGTKGKAKVKNEMKEEVKEELIQAPDQLESAKQVLKASSGKKGKAKVKNEMKEEVKEWPIQAPDQLESAKQVLKASSGKKGKAKVDSACPLNTQGNWEVFEDYDCMLNQTNIGLNINKFYIIQLLSDGNNFYCWNRSGRVGEVGQYKLNPFNDPEPAIKDFEKKFCDTTKNAWSDREKFTPHPGKYTLIEVEHDDEEEDGGAGEVAVKVDKVDGASKNVQPCSLDKLTQELSVTMSELKIRELDIKKMPLGKLSKAQIAKGFEALEELQDALEKKANKDKLSELTSLFYTIIPHNFGRTTPPVIDSQDVLQAQMDMLLELAGPDWDEK